MIPKLSVSEPLHEVLLVSLYWVAADQEEGVCKEIECVLFILFSSIPAVGRNQVKGGIMWIWVASRWLDLHDNSVANNL